MTNIVLFIDTEAGFTGKRLLNRFQLSFPDKPLEIISSIKALKIQLRKPILHGRGDIHVILADSTERLKHLLSIAEYFNDRRSVLIVPDGRKTLSDAYRLRPRLVGNVGGNYDDLCAVVRKMIGRGRSEREHILKSIGRIQ